MVNLGGLSARIARGRFRQSVDAVLDFLRDPGEA